MSFVDEEEGHEFRFVGSATEVTRQIGTAVPVRLATALVGAARYDALAPAKGRGSLRAHLVDPQRAASEHAA